MGIWYCTREDVKSALDSAETARNNTLVDRAIEAASRTVEGSLHRKFYPQVDTRYFDWPNSQYARSWRLWLDSDEIISVTSVTSGGTTITAADYFLEPANSGPPFRSVDIDLASNSAFSSGDTPQRSIAITGTFGYNDDTTSVGTLAEALDSSETGVDVSNSALIGVGSLLLVGSEYMNVTGKALLDTGAESSASALAAQMNVTTVPVDNGALVNAGEVITLDSERMLVLDVAGNNLIVKRAYDGTVLAAHTSATVYAPRTLTVERGAVGSTAAAHDTAAAVAAHVVPGPVRTLTIAEAIVILQQESGGYANPQGSGSSTRPQTGVGLDGLRYQAYTTHGRKARIRAV